MLREDPDIVLVGEMRDLETIEAALTLSETGHLVFGTLHTRNGPSTIDRIIDVFPTHQQDQIRVLLGNTLEAVIAQQLLPRFGGGRAAAIEVMLGTAAIKNLIREGKTHQMYSIIETSKNLGMQTMDSSLATHFLAMEPAPTTSASCAPSTKSRSPAWPRRGRLGPGHAWFRAFAERESPPASLGTSFRRIRLGRRRDTPHGAVRLSI